MKRFLCLSVFCALLGGCAGSASEFECNATTSDRCMTMEQANEMARKKDRRGHQGKAGCGRVARPG
ncbi:TraV family lipoprotein (plasmid) [Aeromonas salmonicida subsp. salmonicida]|uniref:TraV family lipoprotein n=1 Tax=Aeromonas salmonicida TaxID=645 RepID=UPI002301984B|nr:TraV family lipoprotein [Aeromonas salmonicida]WCB52528.1 TraV family lipoprotein [Aeromonas salmonicida subsp. salmonicida]